MSKKRGNGEGSIRRLPSGNWSGQIMDGYTDEGKRHFKSFSAPTRSEVVQKIREYSQEVKEKGNMHYTDYLFKDFADLWYDSYKTQVEASTYSSYHYTLKFLKDYFAIHKLTDIKTTSINGFMNSLITAGYSHSQISKCRAMLIQIFDAAEADDIINKNYARRAFRGSNRMLKQNKSHTKDAFTQEEVKLLLEQLPNDIIGNSIRLLLVAGLRMQELLALTPQDIAQDGSWVNVNKAVKTVDGAPILGEPKSLSSNRVVPIPKAYREHIIWLRENAGQAFLWCSAKRTNLLYDVGSVRRRYYRAIAKVPGVRKLSPHCCRHTYVTMLQRNGVPLETIAKLTGHSDIKVTTGYSHIDNDSLCKAVEFYITTIRKCQYICK